MAIITIKGRTINIPYPAQTITANGCTVTFPQDSMTVQLADESVTVADASPVTVSKPTDTLVLALEQSAYQGNAKFQVKVDGVIAADNVEVTQQNLQTFAFVGQYSQAQAVTITFLNDQYGGTADTDRNLYVKAVAVNNKPFYLDKTDLLSTGETATATPSNPNPASPSAPNTEGTQNSVTEIKAGNVFKSIPEGKPVGAVDATTLGFKGDGMFDNKAAFEALKVNSVWFPAGVYFVSAGVPFKANTVYWAGSDASIKIKTNSQSIGYFTGDNVTLKGLTFDGGGLNSWDTFNKNVTIQYCKFVNHRSETSWEMGSYLFFQHGASGKIQFNLFSDRMPPDSINLDYHVKGSDPDYGAGAPPCGLVGYGLADMEISYNNFTNVFQPIKLLKLPLESDTKYTVQSGVKINYNYAEQVHRIFIEQQSVNSGLNVVGNVAKHWNLPYWESYGLSLASPQSVGTVCQDNFLYHGDIPYNATPSGLGIEFGSQQGICKNNTVYGPWMIQVFGGSKGCKVNGNRIASNNTVKDFQFAGLGDEHGKTDTDYSGNDARPGGGTFPKEWAMYDLSISGIKA